MTIPTFEDIMLPLLQIIQDKKEYSLRQVEDALAKHFGLTEEERSRILPSGGMTYLYNRLGWAKTDMKFAGCIEQTGRGSFRISEKGLSLLKEKPTEITAKLLTRYDDFVEFQSIKKVKKGNGDLLQSSIDVAAQSPEESLEYAYQKLHSELSIELLNLIKSCSPDFFEKLVIDLLIKMGYGGSRREAGQAMGKSGEFQD